MPNPAEETLFSAAAWELLLLYDDGRGLPDELAAACHRTLADLEGSDASPDLVQKVHAPTDDGRMSLMVCPGWRLMSQVICLRRHRTFH